MCLPMVDPGFTPAHKSMNTPWPIAVLLGFLSNKFFNNTKLKPMTYSFHKALMCLLFLTSSYFLLAQEDYFNTAILVIDGQAALVALDDRDNVSDVLMYLPDYFESQRTEEEYLDLLLNSYVLGAIEVNQQLRFLEFPERGDNLTPSGIRDLEHIAKTYVESDDCLDVVVTASQSPFSDERIGNIVHSLRAFGIDRRDIRVEISDELKGVGQGIVKIVIEDDPQ